MSTTTTAPHANGSARREALRWLARQVRWERTLADLRDAKRASAPRSARRAA